MLFPAGRSRLATAARRQATREQKVAAKTALLSSGLFLGLLQQHPEQWFKGAVGDSDIDAAWVEGLLAERQAARKRKDFAESDRIRDVLSAKGIVIEDGPQGARWKIVKPNDGRDERAA